MSDIWHICPRCETDGLRIDADRNGRCPRCFEMVDTRPGDMFVALMGMELRFTDGEK